MKFKSVLLIEDDPITLFLCEKVIKLSFFAESVISCRNAAGAFEVLDDLKNNESFPEIIFLDILLNGMDGWSFLDVFNSIKSDFKTLPRIYLLTSSVDPEDFKKAEENPLVTDIIVKPLSHVALEGIVP